MSKFPEYNWTASESAPVEYVMQIIDGHFELADGNQKGIPTRVTLNNGWGDGRSAIVSDNDTQALPVAMEITWFSFREDTYYRGKFTLPYEKISKLYAEENIAPYTGIHSSYTSIIVGIAPEGYVVVWLSGGRGKTAIFTGYAKPVDDVPWEVVFSNPEFTKEEIMKETIDEALDDAKGSPNLNTLKYWQHLHNNLFNYDIIVESPYTYYSLGARFLNKTSRRFYFDEQHRWSEESRSMPLEITFAYIFPDRIPVVSIDNIDTQEMFAAFQHLSKNFNGTLKVIITIEGKLEGWGYKAKLRVENDEESIEIKGFKFAPFDNSEALSALEENKDMQRFVNKIGQPATP